MTDEEIIAKLEALFLQRGLLFYRQAAERIRELAGQKERHGPPP